MNVTQKLLIDFIIIGIACGLYLQYKGFKSIKAVPDRAKRRNRSLTREEVLKLVAATGYTFMGAWFEMFSISQALYS